MAATAEDINHKIDFGYILEQCNLTYKSSEYYLQVGDEPSNNDKIIFISIIRSQIPDALRVLAPQLFADDLTFKVAKDKEIASGILNGNFGYNNIGKVFKIYIPKEHDFDLIIKKLITSTSVFSGPMIPNLLHLGGSLYIQTEIPSNSNAASTEDFYSMKVFKRKYLVLSVIKPDIKGVVLMGLYFSNFLRLRRLIIKEGKRFMWSDEGGRDMTDRLKWQCKIHNDLFGMLNIPKVIDFFEQDGNAYFAMEYINGTPISDVINDIYRGRCWRMITKQERIRVLDLLLEIIDMLEILHNKGYIHRDLTPANFLITKKNKIYMIDLEMAYGTADFYPYPVFQYGTAGFMSPEQKRGDTPTEKEDIYALGALMIFFFTNMPPVKFDLQNSDHLFESLFFFTWDNTIGECVSSCLEEASHLRPSLSDVKNLIINKQKPQKELSDSILVDRDQLIDPTELTKLIRNAISGLITSKLGQSTGLFHIRGKVDLRIANTHTVAGTGMGLMSPITGILYLLSQAGTNQYDFSTINFFKDYLKKYLDFFIAKKETSNPGLLFGEAGKAIALHFISLSGVVPEEKNRLIQHCFEKTADSLDFANGVAGQLSALLLIYSSGQPTDVHINIVNKYVGILLESQENNGSWSVIVSHKRKGNVLIGIADGVAGILLPLIKYDQLFPSDRCKNSIKKGLLWLMCNINISGSDKNKSRDISLFSGTAGIALVFLYAYEHFEEKAYRVFAENILSKYDHYFINSNYGLSDGLSGLGVVYSEAARICQTNEWLERAAWIYNIINHTAQQSSKDKIFWIVNSVDEEDQSLLTGNGGIILFLLTLNKMITSKR